MQRHLSYQAAFCAIVLLNRKQTKALICFFTVLLFHSKTVSFFAYIISQKLSNQNIKIKAFQNKTTSMQGHLGEHGPLTYLKISTGFLTLIICLLSAHFHLYKSLATSLNYKKYSTTSSNTRLQFLSYIRTSTISLHHASAA